MTTRNECILKSFADAYFEVLSAQFLKQAFRKIALTYSVSTSDFYDTVHECMFSQEQLVAPLAKKVSVDLSDEEQDGYVRVEQAYKSNLKLHRLIKRVAVEKADGDKFFCEKVFDERLGEVMIATYDSVVDLLGEKTVEETVAEGAAVANLSLSDSQIKRLSKNALACENREAFAFPECAVLGCLFLSLQRASIDALNKPIENPRQIYRLKERFKKMRDTLESKRFRDALVREVFALLIEFNKDEYNDTLDLHLREFWISEKGQGLKYLDYALEHYQTSSPQNLNLEDPVIVDEERWSQMVNKFLYQHKYLEQGGYFFDTIMPLAESVATGVLSKKIPMPESKPNDEEGAVIDIKSRLLESDQLDRITKAYVYRKNEDEYRIPYIDYVIAVKLAMVAETYVDNVKKGVISLLECLPETAVANEQGLGVFWSNI